MVAARLSQRETPNKCKTRNKRLQGMPELPSPQAAQSPLKQIVRLPMNIDQETDWVKESKFINDLDLEVCFQLQDNFYVGDPNSHEQLQDEKYR